MKLTKEEARDILCDMNEDWQIVRNEIVDHSRWAVGYDMICLHLPTQEHYRFSYDVGATEYQDQPPFEYDDEVVPTKVVAKIVTHVEWVDV